MAMLVEKSCSLVAACCEARPGGPRGVHTGLGVVARSEGPGWGACLRIPLQFLAVCTPAALQETSTPPTWALLYLRTCALLYLRTCALLYLRTCALVGGIPRPSDPSADPPDWSSAQAL